MGICRVGSVLLPHPGACIIQFLHVFPCFGKDAIFFPLGGVTYNEMFTKCIMSLQKGLCYMPRLVSLSTCSLCPPCASAFLARRSSERGWPLLHMLIAGQCELCAGLIVLLRHQRAPRVSVEQGPGELASQAPAGCCALKLLQLSCSVGCQVQLKPVCFSEGSYLVGAVRCQQETASSSSPSTQG